MGMMDAFINAMKLGEGEDGYDDGEFLDEPDDIAESKPVSITRKSDPINDEGPRKPSLTKSPISRARKTSNGMEVCVIKPTSVEEAREITETLLSNRTVVLNMEGLDVDVAQRIIDFTSGSCYAIRGNLQKISHYIFIITPASVDVSGDFQEILSNSFDVPSL